MKFNGWKVATILLTTCCVAEAYFAFDTGISLTYARAGEESSIAHGRELAQFIEYSWVGQTKEQIMPKLQDLVKKRPEDFPFVKSDSEEDAVFLGGIRFEFKDDKLVKIE